MQCDLQLEVSSSGSSLVQKSPIDRGVSECGREPLIMSRPWPTRGYCATRIYIYDSKGARGGAVVKALRYKPEGRGIDSRWCQNFSLT
jgi:hypothetical protein